MKKQIIAFVNPECSGLRMIDRELFISFLRDFGPETKLKITVEHYFPQRSLKQNGALHWWIDLLAEELGIEAPKLKELLAFKFLKRPMLDKKGEEMVDEDGVVEMYVPSTADLDKLEMGVFMDNIWQWALHFHGINLPLPDENYKLNFQEEHKLKLKDG